MSQIIIRNISFWGGVRGGKKEYGEVDEISQKMSFRLGEGCFQGRILS
jgi:hypothetical protein